MKTCTYCIMDETDPSIVFDNAGRCNHCRTAEALIAERCKRGDAGIAAVEALVAKVKEDGKGKDYDCIIGLSGGADSTYLAYLATKVWGLRVLAVHVNAGWNSEIAESNIEKLIKSLGMVLHTYVVDWGEVRELQRAYLKSGLANQDVPQDHVFFAVLYKLTVKEGIKHVFTGHNLATESILPFDWGYNAMDVKQLKAVFKRFGKGKLNSYKKISFFYRYIYLPYLYKVKIAHPLNFIEYDKEAAKKFLAEECGWVDYGVKHGESVFTRFFQNYWLPKRFGFDKRKAHLSSMIVSGKITREQALEAMNEALYDPITLENDITFVSKKLRFSRDEFEGLLAAPLTNFKDYPSNHGVFQLLMKIRSLVS